jgi:hypothetical protein
MTTIITSRDVSKRLALVERVTIEVVKLNNRGDR